MPTILWLLAAWAVALIVNLVPAFMPPTWSVLTIFKITAGLPLLPLTLGGVAMAALGRVALALLSRRYGEKLPRTDRENAEALGAFVNTHERWREVIVFGYCLAPLPSNPLFIAAGVGDVPLLPVTLAYFCARAIVDTLYVWSVERVSKSAGGLFLDQLTSWKSLAVQVVSVILLALVFRLPWAKWLGLHKPKKA